MQRGGPALPLALPLLQAAAHFLFEPQPHAHQSGSAMK
jgi:hypothetical protein